MNTTSSPERFPSVVIENLSPLLDGGRYPLKRVVDQELVVSADIFKDGHDLVAAVLKWRPAGVQEWWETPMTQAENDRWSGIAHFVENTEYELTIEAWGDEFVSWRVEYDKKFNAGITELATEIAEGAILIEKTASRTDRKADKERSPTRVGRDYRCCYRCAHRESGQTTPDDGLCPLLGRSVLAGTCLGQ